MNKLIFALLLWIPFSLWGHEDSTPVPDRAAMWQKMLERQPIAVGAAFAPDGTLWQASVLAGHLRVQSSNDFGANFSEPILVNPEAEIIAANGENRPQIAFSQGLMVLAWAQSLPDIPFTGLVRFSVSADQGKTWSTPANINDDSQPAGHSFVSLVSAGDQLQAVWLDGRLRVKNPHFKGSAVYSATFIPEQQRFGRNRKLAEHSCECCQLASASDRKGNSYAIWRHIFKDNIRDHALVNLNGKEFPVRATFNNWHIEACPHHGPGLSIDKHNTKHLVWFNQDERDAHVVFYGQMKAKDSKTSGVRGLGNTNNQVSLPAVISTEQRLVLAWVEFDGENALLMSSESSDFGKSFRSAQVQLSRTDEYARPILLAFQERVFALWNSPQSGLKIIEIQPQSEAKL